MIRTFTLALATIFALASIGHAGEISSLFQAQEDAGGPTTKPADKTGVTEIGMERTPCFGNCPVFTFIVKSDGTFRYHGVDFVDRKGDFTGTIGKEQFDALAKLVIKGEFMSLKSKYSRPITDHPTVFTMAVVDGNRKIVSDYAHAGPEGLSALESAMMDAWRQAKWDEKK